MTEFASIQQIWQTHLSRPFPRGLGNMEFDGHDLGLLDSLAAGSISTFLGNTEDPTLDTQRLDILTDCAKRLSRICPQLPDEHRVYFDTLREISERVVRFCGRDLKR